MRHLPKRLPSDRNLAKFSAKYLWKTDGLLPDQGELVMRRKLGLRIAAILEKALIDGRGLGRGERESLIASARELAFGYCEAESDREVVEMRSLEKRLLSACMSASEIDEIRAARDRIVESAMFSEGRKRIMVEIAERAIVNR